MKDKVKKIVKKAKEKDNSEVNINIRIPRQKRDAFNGWCAENEVTASSMLLNFIDDCIMLDKI